MLTTVHPYDLIIGLDRSDRKADLDIIDTHTGQQTAQTVETSPESLQQWLHQLRQHYPQARVALILEQPALNLIGFLESIDWITLYAINPITLQKFREAFVTSRAKDDAKDDGSSFIQRIELKRQKPVVCTDLFAVGILLDMSTKVRFTPRIGCSCREHAQLRP